MVGSSGIVSPDTITGRAPMNHMAPKGAHSDVVLSGISKSFGALDAVRDVSLHIPTGSFFSLLGPSGCGKSTTLRMIAGFETPDAGQILIGDVDITHTSPQRRPTAMVFQNYALFPHMSVAENVEYGLRVRRVEKSVRFERVRSALARVDMEEKINAPVTDLSGGQQQRVALARAIAIEPAVLLFDEPLSNLDVALREQTRRELKSMQTTLGVTSVYVTHDQEEALALSDQIAVMRDGKIIQVGSPDQLYREPETAFVAGFLGGANLISGDASSRLAENGVSDTQVLAVRPENIIVGSDGKFTGRFVEKQFLGSTTTIWLDWEGTQIRASVSPDQVLGAHVRFNVSASRWVTDDRDTVSSLAAS